jgi:penicillin-binding protein 1A
VAELPVPPGVVSQNGDWYFEEYAPGSGIAKLGHGEGETASTPSGGPAPIEAEERKGILDLFRN